MGLNIEREKVIMKGYANIKDIQRFIPCSFKTAKIIDKEIRDAAKENHKRCLKYISAKSLLSYVSLTENQILKYADIERSQNI